MSKAVGENLVLCSETAMIREQASADLKKNSLENVYILWWHSTSIIVAGKSITADALFLLMLSCSMISGIQSHH
jgi:hypothetical protein